MRSVIHALRVWFERGKESPDSLAWMSAVTESGGWSASTATRMPRGDVPGAGPGRQPLALGALAGARRSEQQQPHGAAAGGPGKSDADRSAGMTMCRFWILPVAPLGSASMIHTCRGYLYAATWPLT